MQFDHVAVLVPSVEKAALVLAKRGCQVGPVETFESEGTREIYVEHGRGGAVLLVEPACEGSYQRALDKRGPGVHHLAINVTEIENFIADLASSGWLLHPSSFAMLKRSRTVFLARPGFPALIEVHERTASLRGTPFVTKIELAFADDLKRLLLPIGFAAIAFPTKDHLRISCGDFTFTLRDIL